MPRPVAQRIVGDEQEIGDLAMPQETRRLMKPNGHYDLEAATIERAIEARRFETRATLVDSIGLISRAIRSAVGGLAAKTAAEANRRYH